MRAPLSLPVGGIERKQIATVPRVFFDKERHAALCGEADEAAAGTGPGNRIDSLDTLQVLRDQNLALIL